ncbi:uncharacterized protein LOC122026202 [Zingiber officinale]|uniref:uncharacterized protein LOC122026202 n=1 Tax=Zingiber officinale TaxID=94328 RepID=UPI001C4A9370|nr:uncharacterized protein LOC122026202 [Zingiber officinale]
MMPPSSNSKINSALRRLISGNSSPPYRPFPSSPSPPVPSQCPNIFFTVPYPANLILLGLNIGGGIEMKLRLRQPSREWDLFPFEQFLIQCSMSCVTSCMGHTMSHSISSGMSYTM